MSNGDQLAYTTGSDPSTLSSGSSSKLSASLKALAKAWEDLAKQFHDIADSSRMLANLYIHLAPRSTNLKDEIAYLARAARALERSLRYDAVGTSWMPPQESSERSPVSDSRVLSAGTVRIGLVDRSRRDENDGQGADVNLVTAA
jgi:hypothetical protein